MTLDVLFRSVQGRIAQPDVASLQYADASEAQVLSATSYLESTFDLGNSRYSRAQAPMSRSQTPMVCNAPDEPPGSWPSPTHSESAVKEPWRPPSKVPFWTRLSPTKKPPAKPVVIQESQNVRKQPLPRPSTLPQTPDVSSYSIEVQQNAEYSILISMFEVYNDRIFDLLSTPNASAMATRQGAALQKGLMRRPLLFKNTEMSQDRKVVAGLRKIACKTYEEAMMVLEAGLHERRVAGTGSNSVSSRSHGFFNIEVKKNTNTTGYTRYDMWSGGTLSIVDLAGSERARNAKTTGSTLAEAGKINESLMYLGQCLQVQSDCQQDGSKPIVPFRQCKLTELLFSNSFPSPNSTYRTPQKAVMIVTADPQGDFNATSQILRYSALAREVTVPRVPSVTSQIQSAGGRQVNTGRVSPQQLENELDRAYELINRLTEEVNNMAIRLTEAEIRASEAELKQQAAEEKALEIEQDVRDECYGEMEEQVAAEVGRWRTAWERERASGEAYMDTKLDLVHRAHRSPTKAR